jgi:hypothetical protein
MKHNICQSYTKVKEITASNGLFAVEGLPLPLCVADMSA